jgi:DNA-binding transcriptional MerR regulator
MLMKRKNTEHNLLSTTEFAKVCGISVAKLHFYDKKDVFKPVERGTGQQSGHRLYSPSQLIAANMVRVLAEIGVPLKEIKEMSETRSPQMVLKLLIPKQDFAAEEVKRFSGIFSVLGIYIESIKNSMGVTEVRIVLANKTSPIENIGVFQ